MSEHAVDLVFLALLVVAMLRGFGKGLLSVAATWAAPVIAFMKAGDWSEPVRERLVTLMPQDADFLLDYLAPAIVFVGVVVAIRLLAALLSSLLGVGRSMPSRVLAAAVSVAVTALVLGSFVVLVHGLRPHPDSRVEDAGDPAPAEAWIVDLDNRFQASLLAPPMAGFANAVVAEAVAHKDSIPLPDELQDAARRVGEEFQRDEVKASDILPSGAVVRTAPLPKQAVAGKAAAARDADAADVDDAADEDDEAGPGGDGQDKAAPVAAPGKARAIAPVKPGGSAAPPANVGATPP